MKGAELKFQTEIQENAADHKQDLEWLMAVDRKVQKIHDYL